MYSCLERKGRADQRLHFWTLDHELFNISEHEMSSTTSADLRMQDLTSKISAEITKSKVREGDGISVLKKALEIITVYFL